jgi:glycosyltransferase involved in cell wall biosynthesis
MRILFIAGGDSPHAYRWIKYFVKQEHNCYWYATREVTQPLIYGDIRYYMPKNDFVSQLYDLHDVIKTWKPDIVHAHYAGLNGLLGALSGFHPYVVTAWGSDVLIAGKHPVKKHAIKYALDKSDLITCDAQHMITSMISMGVNPLKIKRINFGVDTTVFTPHQIPHGMNGVISLRNLEPIYDIETLIRAIPMVIARYPNTIFYIGGKGSDKQRLLELIMKTKVQENAAFLDELSTEDVRLWFSRSDVYVSTSLSDAGISASTAEAMACGLPSVITDNGENREWTHDTFPNGDYLKLSELICKFLESPSYSRLVGIKNRRTIQERNDYFTEMNRMEKVYQCLIH